jgi:hypothetical protein
VVLERSLDDPERLRADAVQLGRLRAGTPGRP